MTDSYIEENINNPTISSYEKINITHHFVIKYNSEKIRKKFAKYIIDLIREFEIKNFHIEEKKAFIQSRIIYNNHTLISNFSSSEELFKKNFLKYFEKE